MCCWTPVGSDEPAVDDCHFCGNPIDADGLSLEICQYSPEECATCGYAPCDGSC